MSEILYPSGYGTLELTINKLMDRHMPVHVTEPEFRRRVRAYLVSKRGVLGLGDILPRSRNNSVSAASAANSSFHQLQTFRDGTRWCAAIDFVVRRPGLGHSSGAVPVGLVPVQGSAEAKRWGIHANIGTPGKRGFEGWHGQPVELDGFWGWTARLRPRPAAAYPLPAPPSGPHGFAPTPPRPAVPPFNPALGMFSLWPLNSSKPAIRAGANGDIVRYLQGVIYHKAGGGIGIDGDFGPQTERRVKDLQRFFGLTVDGWVGKQTWGVIDFLAGT